MRSGPEANDVKDGLCQVGSATSVAPAEKPPAPDERHADKVPNKPGNEEKMPEIRIGAEAYAEAPGFRVALRKGLDLETLRLPKLPWSAKLPRSLLGQGRPMDSQAEGVPDASDEVPVRPDGSVRLRIFDGAEESQLAVELPCTIFGSSLRSAHVADGTHSSVKTEHAALIFVPPQSYLLQPLNGEVTVSCASDHACVAATLLKERRSAPQRAASKLLSVGSAPEEITRQHCCFQLGKSELVWFLDLLPSAASVPLSCLGTILHCYKGT